MKKRKSKTLSLLLVVVMCVGLLAACESAPQTPATGDGTTPTVPAAPAPPVATAPGGDGGGAAAAVAEPPPEDGILAEHIDIILDATGVTVLNPMLPAGGTAGNAWFYNLVHDRLIEIRGPGEYVPGLATRWETDDFQTIRFYLRDDVTWHNGEHFTSECVVFTWNMAHQNPTGLAFAKWSLVQEAIAVEPYVLELVLNNRMVEYEFEFSHFATPIFNERAYLDAPNDPNWTAVGTGPFRVTGFATNNYISLERNENYWGELPPTRSMTLWTIPEMATRRVMLTSGEAQISFQMSPDDLDDFLVDPDFSVIIDTSFPAVLSFVNGVDPIVNDRNFRLAVAHALNVEDIALVASGNWARPAQDGNFWPLVTPFRRTDLPIREFNLDTAREYLAASAWDGQRMEIATAGDAAIRATEMIQHQLGVIGIEVDVAIMDVPSFIDAFLFNPESTRQMWHFSLAQPPSAIGFATANLLPGIGTNRVSLNDPHFTSLINELAAEGDVTRAREIAYEMQEWLWNDMSSIPLYFALSGIPAVHGVGGLNAWGNAFFYCLRGLYWDVSQTPEHLRP